MKTEKQTQLLVTGSSTMTGETETPARTALKKQLQCGSCEFLVRNQVFESRCSDMGKIPSSRSCGSHRPDAFTLAGGEERVNLLLGLSEIMHGLSPNDMQIMAGLMLGEKTTRKAGFRFHQKVYIRVQGGTTSNYMSNFAVGYVLSADRDNVKVIGESGALSITFLNDKDSLTLYTVKRFNELRREMVENKRYVDPEVAKLHNMTVAALAKAAGNVKAFDTAVEEGLIAPKKRSERSDLVALVTRLGKGQLKIDREDKVKKPPAYSSGSSVKFKN